MSVRILQGDCRDVLKTLPAESVHCVVTSPPYFGLRDYGVDGQIGLEPTPDAFVTELVAVFREARRVLRSDGTVWLNLGDSYGRGDRVKNVNDSKRGTNAHAAITEAGGYGGGPRAHLKPKDLVGIPWRVAFALQADGWILRQWLPWVKRNPMPESTRDRPTSACETVFLLSKSQTYFYDYEAVKKTMAPSSTVRLSQDVEGQQGSDRANGGRKINGAMKAVGGDKQRGHSRRHAGFNDRWDKMEREQQCGDRAFRNSDLFVESLTAPHGGVFSDDEMIALDVATQPYSGAHFAVMPADLAEPCIKAGCPAGGTVLDPFGGAGTTGLVADRLQRNAILIELSPAYATMAEKRIHNDAPLFSEPAP